MNCLEFRRQLLTEPEVDDPALVAHEHDCEQCGLFAQNEARFERDLKEVMSIDVPKGLAERIKMRQGIVEEVHRKHVRPWRYAVAASLLLVMVVVVVIGYQTQRLSETEALLQQAVLDHIHGELQSLVAQQDIELEQLNLLLKPLGGHASSKIGKVNYASRCEINEHLGVHFILDGHRGPVTVIYISNEQVRRDSQIKNARFDGMLIPAGEGSLAIVGERGEALDELTERLKNNIKWNI